MNDFLKSISGVVTPIGIFEIILVSVIAIRMMAYWSSFFFGWQRYRERAVHSNREIIKRDPPHLKIQITTRGSEGSTEVILRGINGVLRLVKQAPQLARYFSVEVITESAEQVVLIESMHKNSPIRVSALAIPADFTTINKTGLKARGLQYAVQARREGWNLISGRVFIVHFDEESVMMPVELRKLLYVLADTDKKILEGPIYYPLEYHHASGLCRSMEANRPAGCFECRVVMEKGVPFHLHGSNLVVEEQLENEIGWDIGKLEGKDFIAEDFVFGLNNYIKYGSEIFGWHGCVMLEQPPFSYRSAFRQRHRWIFGVLQGLYAAKNSPAFNEMSRRTRQKFLWATRFRVFTFAAGSVVGALSMIILPLMLAVEISCVVLDETVPFNPLLTLWMTAVGGLWLGTVMIGAWLNVRDANMTGMRRELEIARAIALSPVAGLLESSAGLRAVWDWSRGKRSVNWITTPKTLKADAAVTRGSAEATHSGVAKALPLPGEETRKLTSNAFITGLFFLAASLVGMIYIVAPLVMFLLPFVDHSMSAIALAFAMFYLGIAGVRLILRAILVVPRGLPQGVISHGDSTGKQNLAVISLAATGVSSVAGIITILAL